jgi:hypothetical protein
MDSEHEEHTWKFCSDVGDGEAELAKNVETLILHNGWKPTEARNGIAKEFAFSSVADALVSCPSIRL